MVYISAFYYLHIWDKCLTNLTKCTHNTLSAKIGFKVGVLLESGKEDENQAVKKVAEVQPKATEE